MGKKELVARIQGLKADINAFEANPDDFTDAYDDMLDALHGEFMGYSASHVLKNVDETAYHCGLLDYVDSITLDEIQEYGVWDLPAYQQMLEELGELEDELEALEEENI